MVILMNTDGEIIKLIVYHGNLAFICAAWKIEYCSFFFLHQYMSTEISKQSVVKDLHITLLEMGLGKW